MGLVNDMNVAGLCSSIHHADGSLDQRISLPYLFETELPGPAGWNEAIQHLLVNEDIE